METCHSCQAMYEPLCLTCNETECIECHWPYKYNQTLKKCYTMGLLEFSVPNMMVIETNYSYFVIVRRTFELKGQVRIDYEMHNSNPMYTRMEDVRGTLIFDEGVEE